MCLPSISIVFSICIVDEQMGRPAWHGPGLGLARHGPRPDTSRPCRAELGFVPNQRPKHGTTGYFSCRAGPKSPAKTCRASLKPAITKNTFRNNYFYNYKCSTDKYNIQVSVHSNTSLSSFKYMSQFKCSIDK